MKQITKQIIHNSIQTPDGTILVSRSVHDFKIYNDANGKSYMIDGGRDYLRRSCNGDEVDLTLYEGDLHEKIREVFTWGTYGKNGDHPIKFVQLKDLSADHIEAILCTQSHMSQYIRNLFIEEQVHRINNGDKNATKISTDSIQE